MHTSKSISELPNRPAVYALMGGLGKRAYVAYVGIAGKLRRRIAQHLVLRDSSVTTGTSAAVLNPDYVTEVRWWESSEFEDRVRLEAAEVVALRTLDPVLRSRGVTSEKATEISINEAYKKSMVSLFAGESTGQLHVPTLQSALKRIDVLEARLVKLENL